MYQEPANCPLLKKGNTVSAVDIDPNRNGHGKVHLELFDRDGTEVATKIQGWVHGNPSLVPFVQKIIQSPLCFTISKQDQTGNGTEIAHFHFFESMYVKEAKSAHAREYRCNLFPHTLTKEMLYTIKYFQLYDDGYSNCTQFGYDFQRGCNLHKLHPELFIADSTRAERKELEEEKAKLFLVKQKLDLMKAELLRERLELERAKEKHELSQIDLDQYFKKD